VLPKIREAREYIDNASLDLDISIDGGVNMETARECLDAGANVLGAATAIFGQPDAGAAAAAMKRLLDERAGGK
jgi:ribulose-phosphate 3-epimerase